METLVGLALKSLLIAGATLLLLQVTRRRSSADRSWIAHLGLVALVALPLASLALPALHIALPDALSLAPAMEEVAAAPVTTPSAAAASGATPSGKVGDPVATPSAAAAVPGFDWTLYAYAVPAIALLLITLLALLRLFALRSRAQVLVDPVWLSALAHAQRRMGFKSGTALLTSNELTSPISWGVMRPVILLNDEALAASGEAEAIIAHELAHVARLDWAKLMLARVATAIFWFNPLAWMLAREAHQLREEATDDAVLAANIADTDYAQLLVSIARHECKGLLLGAHGISPGRDSLRRRVSRVLDGSLVRGPGARSWVAGFAAGMLVMAAPLAALTFAPRAEDKLSDAEIASAEGRPAAAPLARRLALDGNQAFAPVAQVTTGAGTTAVAAATAMAHPREDWREDWSAADEIARDARIDARESLEEARHAIDEARRSRKDAIDVAIERKALGVTPDFIASIRAAGPQFRDLDSDEFVELKIHGVTPQYVRALKAAGYGNASVADIGSAAVLGVTVKYISDIAAAGYRGISLEDLTEMRTMGVNRAYIEQLRRAGYSRLSPDRLIELRTLGVRPEDILRRRPTPGPQHPIGPPLPRPAPAPPQPH